MATKRSGMRLSAEERRRQVVAIAVAAFAEGGLQGTSTERIAREAGVSQPYLFRLFPTKLDLFLAAVDQGFARVRATFAEAADGLEDDEALMAMGQAYGELLEDRDLLRLQLQAYAAAAGGGEVCDRVRAAFAALVVFIRERTGVDGATLEGFVAQGMLCNVVASLDHGGPVATRGLTTVLGGDLLDTI